MEFNKDNIIGVYFRYRNRTTYRIDRCGDSERVNIYFFDTKRCEANYPRIKVLEFLNSLEWEFITHKDIIGKNEFLLDLIQSHDNSNIEIVKQISKRYDEKIL